jgi:hypothetical protein
MAPPSRTARRPIRLSRVLRDLLIGALPAAAAIVVASALAKDDSDTMNTVVYPGVAGIGMLIVVIVLLEVTPFLWRFVTGRVPGEAPRTLRHLDKQAIKAQLRTEHLSGQSWVCYTNDVEEEDNFALEISDLLDQCGWLMMKCGQGACGGYVKRPVDVEIYPPDGGSPGLTLLNELINRSGYRSVLREGGGIGHACIQIGPPTH